jgi:hypothetical protein
MDYLPVQATSIPCERVFSSAKDTDTAKRNRISPMLMEGLQVVKFMLKKEQLNFVNGWQTSEAAMSVVAALPPSFDSAFEGDRHNALDQLLKDLLKYDNLES